MYENELELIFLKLNGINFQYFFNDLMVAINPDFIPIRQRNDGGNDGFILNGTYYQVYAPENVTADTIRKGTVKIVEDFNKLIKNWDETSKLKEYIFVINDKNFGVDPNLIKKLKESIFDSQEDLDIKVEIYTSRTLESMFHDELSIQKKQRLISKHLPSFTRGRTSIETVANIISNKLDTCVWEDIDEDLSYDVLSLINEELLRDVLCDIFDIRLDDTEDRKVVNDVLNSIKDLIDKFNCEFTYTFKGEKKWDNRWKRINNNPKAQYYDEQIRIWEKQVFTCSVKLVTSLNSFSNYIRDNYIMDYQNHKQYVIERRTAERFGEYSRIIY